MKSARDFTYGAAIGAGLMFLLDPRAGGARRAVMRQKATRAAHEVERATGIGARDLRHRFRGLASIVFGPRRPAAAPGDVLVARVRAKLGRVCAHAHAIEVDAKGGGVIALRGPILEEDHERVLSALRRVRGVRAIDDGLEVHAAADVPALQGSARPSPARPTFRPATRFVIGLGAAGLSLASLARGSLSGFVAGGAAVLMLARSVSQRGAFARPILRRDHAEAPPAGLREAYPEGSEWAPSTTPEASPSPIG